MEVGPLAGGLLPHGPPCCPPSPLMTSVVRAASQEPEGPTRQTQARRPQSRQGRRQATGPAEGHGHRQAQAAAPAQAEGRGQGQGQAAGGELEGEGPAGRHGGVHGAAAAAGAGPPRRPPARRGAD